MITRQCKQCQEEFQPDPREVKRGNGYFCSLSCSAKFNSLKRSAKLNKPNVSCAYCQKRFYKSPSKQKKSKSGLFFCCRAHKDLANRLDGIKAIHPPHFGQDNSRHYRTLALRKLPNRCNRCPYDKFVEALVVHHKDHDRSNNKLSNLEVLCPTCHWEHHLGLTN